MFTWLTGSTLGYSVWIWIGTGLYLLLVDTIRLQNLDFGKEKKTARFAGWINLAMGVLLMLIYLFT